MVCTRKANDVDFLDVDIDALNELHPVATSTFKEWNLDVNQGKTEFVEFRVASSDELFEDGKPIRGNEPWCTSKLLGSLMCSVKDINRRCILGNVAFNSFSKAWLNSKITLSKKLNVYNAQVVSVIMYNASCWAAPKHVLRKLDACHRKHLRKIMNIKWPRSMISNETLYKRCKTTKLSLKADAARWKMLGHVLRSDELSPAQAALRFTVKSMNDMQGRVGRHRDNLFQFIKNDVQKRGLSLNTLDDIIDLKVIASDRARWRKMF